MGHGDILPHLLHVISTCCIILSYLVITLYCIVMTRKEQRIKARKAAGFPERADAAKKAGMSDSYLRRLESYGDAPYHTALRLSQLFQCSLDLYL